MKLAIGIAIGVIATLGYFAYFEDSLPGTVLGALPVEVSMKESEPPTVEEVQQRAKELDMRSTMVAFGSIFCPEALGIVNRAEADMKEKFPETSGMSIDELISLEDTRLAMETLDATENMVEDLEKACLR